jgi:FtsH-binding integral membrane protein
MKIQLTPSVLGRIIATLLLILAAFYRFPYSFYQILRWAVFAICGYSAYISFTQNKTRWVVSFALIALLFNPILSFHFSREIWQIFNIIAAIVTALSILIISEKDQ